MAIIEVGVFDEHEIFRRGAVACVNEDAGLRVVARGASAPDPPSDQDHVGFDVAVVSPAVVLRQVHAVGEQLAAPLDRRSLAVLRMLADGAATREISDQLGYSERTIRDSARRSQPLSRIAEIPHCRSLKFPS